VIALPPAKNNAKMGAKVKKSWPKKPQFVRLWQGLIKGIFSLPWQIETVRGDSHVLCDMEGAMEKPVMNR
jgi:hypothetical protein